LINNMVVDNYGGGFQISSSDVRMLHTTLARNEGVRALSADGGTTLWMTNTIVVSHTRGVMAHGAGTVITAVATLWGEGVWANEELYVEALSGGTVITVTDVWGDPAFVDPAAGDYHISPASAAVDAGVYCGVDTDIDSQARPRDGKYDIGADELDYFVYLPLVLRNY
jgi:hypothetical protein